jgi:ABC-type multidrug transport system fused ATPase/permease subunit
MRKIFSIIVTQNPRYLLYSMLQIITSIIEPFISIFLIKYMLDALDQEVSFETGVGKILLFLAIGLIVGNLKIIADNFTKLYAKNQMIPMSMLFCKKSIEMDYQNIENPVISNEMNRAINVLLNKDSLERYLGSINSICIALGQLIITMMIMSQLNYFILITILAITVGNYFINLTSEKQKYKIQREIAPIDREWKYLRSLTHDVSFGQAIRIYNLNYFLLQKIDHNRNRFMAIKKRMLNRDFSRSLFVDILNLVQEIIIFVWLVFSVIYNQLSLGNFSIMFNASQQLTESFSGLSNAFVKLYENDNYINDYFSFLQREDHIRGTNGVHINQNSGVGDLQFHHVSFKYPGSERYTIQNLNLTIKHGERISIVGDNGAGKTTIVKLIMRLYDVTEGEITYNGVNIKQYDYDDYLAMISTVFQDFKIFATSIYENIALDRYEESEIHKLDQILESCGLTDKVQSLPGGGQTILSYVYDHEGIELSEGQKQSVALGRAIYKDSPIVILDEPTASLSPMAERDLYTSFDSLIEGKMAIYISHRLSSAQISDKICVIQEGMLAEYGSHEELMNLKGIYANMFALQSKYYEPCEVTS